MVGKNNEYVNQKKAGNKFEKYSIKKLKVGAASVLIGAGFFLGHHVEASEVVSGTTVVATQEKGTEEKEKKISEVTDTTVQPKVVPTTNNGTTATPKTEVVSTSKTEVVATPKSQEALVAEKKANVETPKSQAAPVAEKKANVEAPVEPKVQTTGLQEKVSALQSEVNRIRANEKHKSQIEQAEKLIEEAKDLQASKTATQKEVEAKVKEIKSLTFILKSMKAEETVKPKKNQDSRNGKKMVKGTGFRIGEGTPGSTPQPEGNVIARGEDGVPWELYGNGYLLFKPEVGKDTLTNNSGESTWKDNYGEQIKHVGFADKVYAPENSRFIFSKYSYNSNKIDRKFNPLTFDTMHFDTSKVTDMSSMFSDLSNLTNLDVTHFDTSKVTDMSSMFGGTGKLKELKLGDKFKADGIRTIPTTHSYGNQYTDKWHKVEDKEHLYTVSDWADAYAGNSTTTAGTWVREVSNATLTFQGENFTPVKVAPSDTALPTLSRPSQPKQNHKFLGWSKDGTNLLTRDAVQPGETITLQPLWQPVNNTTTRTEEIPIATIYRADETIPFESRQEVAGQKGEKTITTTYTVAPYTGELTNPVDTERVTTGMQPKVIKVGNKKVVTESIPVTNKYVGNEEKDRGYSNLTTQGQDGSRTITTTYTVNETTGNLSDLSTSETSTPMTQNVYEVGTKPKVIYGKEGNKVVKTTTTYVVDPTNGNVTEASAKETISEDGAKDKVVTEDIEPKVVYEKDDSREKDSENITTPGQKGSKVTTTTYTVNENTGAVEEHVGEPVITPATNTVVKVAAKDKVTYKKQGDNVVKTTTVYTVNPENGNITEASTDEVTQPNGAKDNAVTPAAKTKVANPEKLTDAEKKAIEDKVKAANPGAEVVVDDKGKAAVVKDGNVSVIPSTDLVKVEGDATKPNGGNDANTPAAKTVVADKESLTPEEKAAVKKAVEAVNSGSTVVVDDKGNATVTKADGTVLNIRASDLVIPVGKLADEVKNAKVKTPATRTLVGNKEELKDFEKEAVKKAIEAVNPGATVVVDDKGNATVTLPDGSTATISKEQLVKDKEAVSKSKHGGDNLDIDLSKVEVTNIADITPEEKAKFQFKVLGAITDVAEFDLDAYIKSTEDGKTVYTSKDGKVKITIDKDGNATIEKDGKKEAAVSIDKAGNVTIVTKEGQVLAIPRDDAFKQRPYVPSNGGGNNGATNTDVKVDKAKLEGAIHQLDELIIKESAKLDAETAKEANDLLADAKKVFANADASQAEVDAMVKRLEEFKLNQASVATDDQAANNATNASNGETSEDVTDAKLAANVSKRNNQKELPNTGTGEEFVIFGAAAASILAGLGVAIPGKKKEDK